MPKKKRESVTEIFQHGTVNTISPELIKRGAASRSRNFITRLDRIELTRGRQRLGAEVAGNSPVLGFHVSKRQDGTEVPFRKIGVKLQYYDGSAWQDIKTDLTDNKPMYFVDVVTPAGHTVYISSVDGLFKLYTANPGSIVDLSDDTVNPAVRAKIIFNKSRLIACGHDTDPTGLYFSRVDRDSNYTEITDEAVGVLGSAEYTHTTTHGEIFGILLSDGTQTVTDDKNGNLQGDGIGTVNYATGEIAVTFNAVTDGAVVVSYLYESPKVSGLANFAYSSTRLAGEGNIQRQDSTGAVSRNVIVFDDKYFTLQDKGSWKVAIDSADTAWDNQPFRLEAATPSAKSAVPTANGIIYVDTYEPEKPELKLIAYNVNNELFVPVTISEDGNGVGFRLNDYTFDADTVVYKFGDFILISCKSNSTANNKTILYNTQLKSFDVLDNGYDWFAVYNNKLHGADSQSPNVYEILSGWDDLDYNIEGEWESGNDRLDTEEIKKVKRFQVEGYMGKSQSFKVYASFDNETDELLGTVDGADLQGDSGVLIGSSLLGDEQLGGAEQTSIFHYLKEFKIYTPKFLKRKIKIVPTGLGYLDIRKLKDSDVRLKGHKLPKKYKNVGGVVGVSNPPSGLTWADMDRTWSEM